MFQPIVPDRGPHGNIWLLCASFELLGVKKIRKLVYLMGNAETDPDVNQYKLDEILSLTRVLNSLVDIPINRYSEDTFELMG